MANILRFLNKIKSARHGKDVRDSIYDSIEAINRESENCISEQNETIEELSNRVDSNIARQNSLENRYEQQIENIASGNVQNAEIVDARCGFGTLGNVIKKKIYHFENVEEMKNCLVLTSGDVCLTSGYYEANDGGSAKYVIRTKKQNDVEDGGTNHFLNNNLVAELIIEGKINVKQFGVFGDNEHDDYERLNLALNTGFKNTYVIPDGIYLISQTIYIESLCNIEMGANAELKAISELDYFIVYNKNHIKGQSVNNYLSGGTINGNDLIKDNLTVGNYAGFSIKDIKIYNFKEKGLVTRTTGSIQATGMKGENINFRNWNNAYNGSVALYAIGGDAKYRNIGVVDIETAVYNEQYCIFELVHHWLSNMALWENSRLAYNKSSYGKFRNCTVDTIRYGFFSDNCNTQVDNIQIIANDLFYTKEVAEQFPVVFFSSQNGSINATNCRGYLNFGNNIVSQSSDSRNKFINCNFVANVNNDAMWDVSNYKEFYNEQLNYGNSINNPDFDNLKTNKIYKVGSLSNAANNPCRKKGILEVFVAGKELSKLVIQRYTEIEGCNVFTRIYDEESNIWTEWKSDEYKTYDINVSDGVQAEEESFIKKVGNQIFVHLKLRVIENLNAWDRLCWLGSHPIKQSMFIGYKVNPTFSSTRFCVYTNGALNTIDALNENDEIIVDFTYFLN